MPRANPHTLTRPLLCRSLDRCVVSGSYADGGTITSARAAARRDELRQRLADERSALHDLDVGYGDGYGGGYGEALWWEGWISDPRDSIVAEWLLGEVRTSHDLPRARSPLN